MAKPASNNFPFKSRLQAREYLNPSIMLVRIETPKDFSFSAGQYVMLKFTLADGSVAQKPISISSAPRDAYLEFIIKVNPEKALSRFFSEADVGTPMELSEPKGNYVAGDAACPLHFIAAGIGLAPARSIYKDLLARRYAHPIRLSLLRKPGHWGAIDAELADTYSAWDNFSYSLIHVSPEQATPEWAWRHMSFGEPKQGEKIFLSGSQEFISSLKAALLARGFAKDNIVIENS